MYYHNSAVFIGRSFKKIIPVIFVCLLFCCSSAKAQHNDYFDSDYGISIGSDYDVPAGDLSYSFKPAINYNLNAMRHSGNFTMNLSFGYHSYKAKQDTFYYQISETDYGKVSYMSFPAYSLYLGLTYDLPVTEQFKIYGGINLGAYYTHYYEHSIDFMRGAISDLHEQDVYLAPRLGFTYMLDYQIGIGLEGKYNFFAPTGNSTYIRDSRLGTLYSSYSAGVRLSYSF